MALCKVVFPVRRGHARGQPTPSVTCLGSGMRCICGVGDAKGVSGTCIGMVVLAGAIVLLPNAPPGLLTSAGQALAGMLLPSATVFRGGSSALEKAGNLPGI